MKERFKKNKIIIVGMMIGLLFSTGSVYAVNTIIESSDVTYDHSKSGGSKNNVQESIDELYQKAKETLGIGDKIYKDSILKGSDPVLGDEMIPVTIDKTGKVKYASLYSKWYDYKTKKWANAVILVESAKDKYNVGNTINEADIESYFVWIPRYKYKIWNLGNYSGYTSLSDLKDTASGDNAMNRAASNAGARLIEIEFESKETLPTKGSQVGQYLTHPAFTLGNRQLSGIWVGKFEVAKNESSNIVVKPNVQSWRNETVWTFFKTLYDYKRNLDSHMMKNIEWGAVAYLSHSIYGKGSEVNINNNSNRLTGYSAGSSTDQSNFPGDTGTASPKTEKYNTPTGYLASTTGNISGIYDMSGGERDAMAAYMDGYGVKSIDGRESGFSEEALKEYEAYLDKYPSNSNVVSYSNRILGDATGEMGPFYAYKDAQNNVRFKSWYGDYIGQMSDARPWIFRGCLFIDGILTGQFAFDTWAGSGDSDSSSRLVLAPEK